MTKELKKLGIGKNRLILGCEDDYDYIPYGQETFSLELVYEDDTDKHIKSYVEYFDRLSDALIAFDRIERLLKETYCGNTN